MLSRMDIFSEGFLGDALVMDKRFTALGDALVKNGKIMLEEEKMALEIVKNVAAIVTAIEEQVAETRNNLNYAYAYDSNYDDYNYDYSDYDFDLDWRMADRIEQWEKVEIEEGKVRDEEGGQVKIQEKEEVLQEVESSRKRKREEEEDEEVEGKRNAKRFCSWRTWVTDIVTSWFNFGYFVQIYNGLSGVFVRRAT